MTIQRQYSLPNCKLILEGLTQDDSSDLTARPQLSIVTNVECYLSGLAQPLTGGRDFLESLARAVSNYAQDCLSGIPHSARRDRKDLAGSVQLHQIEKNLHRLSINPQALDGVQAASFPPPTELDLTTVQLFDLVEAIDQLFADAQTLPDLSLTLTPLSKRFVVSQKPVTKRAVPAAIGVSSLAAAAFALFFLPIPEVRRQPTADSSESPQAQSPTPSPNSASPEGSPSPQAASPTSSPTSSPEATESPAASPTSSPTSSPTTAASPTDLEAILSNSDEILDPAILERLTGDLQSKLYAAWDEKPPPSFSEPLEYRVGVNESGQIVGYKFVNDAALTYLSDIPLSDVQFGATANNEPRPDIAQFLVVFRPEGVLEISPWYGLPVEPIDDQSADSVPEQ